MHCPALPLNKQQTGRLAETIAITSFLSWGFEVFVPLVDDRGIDFLVRHPDSLKMLEIQVKGVTGRKYAYIRKSTTNPKTTHMRYVCYARFDSQPCPELFLIPVKAWESPNPVLVDYAYDSPGCKSKPEYGINYSKKNAHLLEPYRMDTMLKRLCEAPQNADP